MEVCEPRQNVRESFGLRRLVDWSLVGLDVDDGYLSSYERGTLDLVVGQGKGL